MKHLLCTLLCILCVMHIRAMDDGFSRKAQIAQAIIGGCYEQQEGDEALLEQLCTTDLQQEFSKDRELTEQELQIFAWQLFCNDTDLFSNPNELLHKQEADACNLWPLMIKSIRTEVLGNCKYNNGTPTAKQYSKGLRKRLEQKSGLIAQNRSAYLWALAERQEFDTEKNPIHLFVKPVHEIIQAMKNKNK